MILHAYSWVVKMMRRETVMPIGYMSFLVARMPLIIGTEIWKEPPDNTCSHVPPKPHSLEGCGFGALPSAVAHANAAQRSLSSGPSSMAKVLCRVLKVTLEQQPLASSGAHRDFSAEGWAPFTELIGGCTGMHQVALQSGFTMVFEACEKGTLFLRNAEMPFSWSPQETPTHT